MRKFFVFVLILSILSSFVVFSASAVYRSSSIPTTTISLIFHKSISSSIVGYFDLPEYMSIVSLAPGYYGHYMRSNGLNFVTDTYLYFYTSSNSRGYISSVIVNDTSITDFYFSKSGSASWSPGDALSVVPCLVASSSSSGGSGSSSGGSYPSSSQTQYSAGSPQTLTSSLSRQSFNYGLNQDVSGQGTLMSIASVSDYFQYPSVASNIFGPMSYGHQSGYSPALGSSEPCYIRQYFDVRLSEGYYTFDWSLPSPPSISYTGDVIAYAASYPGIQGGSVSGSFYSGRTGSVVPPSGITQVDGYYYVPNTGIYTFYCDFNYSSSWPPYVLSGDLTAVAPNPPQLIVTPYTKSTVDKPGSEIPLPSAPTDTSDTSSKANTDAILSYLGSLYVQYLKDSTNQFTSYFPVVGPNNQFYPSPLFTLQNQSPASILNLMNSQNASWWSYELSFLNAISSAIPQLSDIRVQLDGSISPVVSLLQSIQSSVFDSDLNQPYFSGIFDHFNDFMLNWASVALDEREFWDAQEKANAQAHSDIWTLISAVRNLQQGDGSVRPWEQFEDDYISNEKSSIESTKDAIDNSNALGSLTDISGGIGSGNYGDSSLGAAEDGVTSGDMYSLWSQTTNDAFNGDVDDWYSEEAIRGRLSW